MEPAGVGEITGFDGVVVRTFRFSRDKSKSKWRGRQVVAYGSVWRQA
ncbi:hypothetical protein OPIT5_00710 [Opitutaceae bacterium TAV5]|nr:hypothetical protein OPIT5_00710 [Opitutaceae bacterium TAV5]